MAAGICASCQQDVLWAKTSQGKRMPIDPEPRPDGNLAVYRDHLGQLRTRVLSKGYEPESYERRGISHFATCPHADRHRRKADGLPGNVVDLAKARRTRG